MQASQTTTTTSNIVHAAMATVVAELVTLPVCTVKTNFQNTSARRIGTVVRGVYERHGLPGFINASPWAVGSQVLATTTKYALYQLVDPELERLLGQSGQQAPSTRQAVVRRVAAGLLSGTCASLLTHPFDVVKTHRQMGQPLGALFATHRVHQVLYRGYTKTLAKATLGNALYYPLFFTLHNEGQLSALTAGAATAVIAGTVLTPVDLAKTRQVYGLPWRHPRGSGIRPYFRGLTLALARLVPHFAITMGIIDLLHCSNAAQR